MRRFLIILLTLITSAIHFYFFFSLSGKLVFSGPDVLFTFFLLNAIGYLGLLGLLYLPLGMSMGLNRAVRWLFIGFTILTIILYFVFSAQSGVWSAPLAPISKVDEAILIWLLWAEGKAQMPAKT